jgi:crotonobetainyl-CoA:carnitine CoA-transferase CaiB-like acyl-CoA transferase
VVDCATALYTTIAILAALERRHATDLGQLVDAVEQITADWAANHTADEIVDLLGQAGVPAARVASIAEVADNPQLRHRGRIVNVDHPRADSLPTVGPVIGLSESPAAIRRPAPRLGTHTDEVLRDWLDLPPERIAALRAGGVVT